MMSLPNASVTSKSISVITYSSTTTRLKLKTEFSFHKTHIFYSLYPKSLIMVVCVICPHSSSYRITILQHRLLCPSIKSFFSAPTMVVLLWRTNDPFHTWNISSARLYMRIKLCSAQQAVTISHCLEREKECISFRIGNLAFNMPKHHSITIRNDECL